VAGRGGEWVESVPDALAGWAGHNRCDAQAREEDPPGPLSVVRYKRCAGDADIRLIRIDGLGHRWAREEVDATGEMWRFFETHTLQR
jgi:polyhydroxybutyrate depolymerase